MEREGPLLHPHKLLEYLRPQGRENWELFCGGEN